jgi:hypothetical protein
MARVLGGIKTDASFQYACHSRWEQRWFLCATGPVEDEEGGALVAHIRLGERRATRTRLMEAGRQGDGVMEGPLLLKEAKRLRRELSIYQHVQEYSKPSQLRLFMSSMAVCRMWPCRTD